MKQFSEFVESHKVYYVEIDIVSKLQYQSDPKVQY